MTTNDLEYRISQYLDGTLPARETREVEQRLSRDPAARALLEEYRQVDALLKSVPAVPAMDYDQLAARISDAVAAVDAEPEVLYSFTWVKRVVGVAVAACATIGVGIWMHGSMGGVNQAVVQVELPRAESAEAPAVAQISIGPSDQANSLMSIEEAIVTRPTKLVIASASPAREDSSSPY